MGCSEMWARLRKQCVTIALYNKFLMQLVCQCVAEERLTLSFWHQGRCSLLNHNRASHPARKKNGCPPSFSHIDGRSAGIVNSEIRETGFTGPRSCWPVFPPLLFLLVTIRAAGRSGIPHGVAGPAEPMRGVLAKAFDLAGRLARFPVTLLAIAFQEALMQMVRKGDPVLEFDGFGAYSRKRRCSCENKSET